MAIIDPHLVWRALESFIDSFRFSNSKNIRKEQAKKSSGNWALVFLELLHKFLTSIENKILILPEFQRVKYDVSGKPWIDSSLDFQ